MKLKKIKVAIDSPAASGAGTISKMLAKEYNYTCVSFSKYLMLLNYVINVPKVRY